MRVGSMLNWIYRRMERYQVIGVLLFIIIFVYTHLCYGHISLHHFGLGFVVVVGSYHAFLLF
jgi:hypothetical protein